MSLPLPFREEQSYTPFPVAFVNIFPYCSKDHLNSATSAMARLRPPRLVTFDIDGTLLKSIGPHGNAAHHRAINEAVQKTFGINVKVIDVNYAGSTDMAIMRRMCHLGGVPSSTIGNKLSAALEYAASRIDDLLDPNVDMSHLVLPGVIPVLDSLQLRGVKLSLATGNIEKIARAKLCAAGINRYFSTGGFGNDAEERHHIVQLAVERSGSFSVEDVVHVGDAIADVAVSRQIGVDAVGVLTGIFTRSQLQAERPLAVLDGFSDLATFFDIIGFSDN